MAVDPNVYNFIWDISFENSIIWMKPNTPDYDYEIGDSMALIPILAMNVCCWPNY